VKIGKVQAILYPAHKWNYTRTFHINCPAWMKFGIRSANNNVKHLWLSWKSAHIGRTFLTDAKEMAYARRPMNPCDILKVKNTVVKFMCYCTSRSTPFSILLSMQKVHIRVYKSSPLNPAPTNQLRGADSFLKRY